MTDEPKAEKVSRKERARQQRREAYLRAKDHRDKDPKFLAMKEAAKQHRHEAYQAAKERKQAATAEQKRERKEQAEGERAAQRATAGELMKKAKPTTRPGYRRRRPREGGPAEWARARRLRSPDFWPRG